MATAYRCSTMVQSVLQLDDEEISDHMQRWSDEGWQLVSASTAVHNAAGLNNLLIDTMFWRIDTPHSSA